MASSAQSEAQCDIGVVDDASTPQISGDAVSFALGDRFESFDGLQSLIKKYEQANFMQFWKRDARTVDAAKKRLDRPLNPALKYYEVKFCCIHGGQTFRSSGKGIRTTS